MLDSADNQGPGPGGGDRSRYDDIHDRFLDPDATRKRGAKYERLAALVAQTASVSSVVLHDQRLGGIAGVPTQIDVVIHRNTVRRRILLECKDFDIAGDPVGVEVVRNLYAVWRDIGADEAWVVTCNDFTGPARAWAKAYGIKLAILREFREADWEGRVREIHVTMNICSIAGVPRLLIDVGNEDDRAALSSLLNTISGTESKLVYPDNRSRPISELIQELPVLDREPGTYKQSFPVEGVNLRHPTVNRDIPITRLEFEYDVSRIAQTMVIKGPGIATLLAQGFGERDLVIWDKDLQKFDIDAATGRVIERP